MPRPRGQFCLLTPHILLAILDSLEKLPATTHNSMSTHSSPKCSIIVPCFNEAGNIFPTAEGLLGVINRYNLDAEILMVDDVSEDATRSEILTLSSKDPRFRLIEKSLPRGMGASIRAGIASARGEWAVIVNGDLSDPLEAIPVFQRLIMEEKCDLVLLNRYLKQEDHSQVRWSYKFYQFLFRYCQYFAVGASYRDITYGYRAFRLAFIRKLSLTGIGFEISPECSVKTFLEKGKVGEAYGKQTCRTIGVSKFKFRKVWKGYVEVLLRGMLHRFGILRYY